MLAILETPVNKFLFDVAIRSSNVGSWLVSFGFALLLLLLAHFAGVSLRHIWSDHRKRLVLGSLLIFILLTFVLLVLVSILTVARAAFSADTGSLQDMFSSVRSAVANLGLWGTLFNAFGDISALVLATINIGGIFVTMMLAFFTHDSDKDFDAAARAVDGCRKKLRKITASYITGKDKIIKEFAPNISGIGADYKSANQHVIELKKRLGRSLDEEEDHLIIDTRDRLAEDSRFGDDVDSKFVAGPDGDIQRAEPPPAPEMRRRGPKIVANDRS